MNKTTSHPTSNIQKQIFQTSFMCGVMIQSCFVSITYLISVVLHIITALINLFYGKKRQKSYIIQR